MNKFKSIFTIVLAVLFVFGFTVASIIVPDKEISLSENSTLQQFPDLSVNIDFSKNILEELKRNSNNIKGFTENFEKYTQDQFPLRDSFRKLKADVVFNLLMQKDNNGYFVENGYIFKNSNLLNSKNVDYNTNKIKFYYDSLLSDSNNVYLAVIPDKNYFLAEENGYLSLDYDELVSYMKEKTSYMTYIDIIDKLSADDYYTTDTHWKQECITDIAGYIGECMGADVKADYTENTLDNPFYGVYYGQSALPFKPDTLKYLTSETLGNCIVTSYDTGKPVKKSVYDMEEAYGKDPYEMFMSGSDALVVAENPLAETDRELVMFRDSFAGSLSPLLLEGYSKIPLVDIRYINPQMLGAFVDFNDCDVLFIYSTMLLNNSTAFR